MEAADLADLAPHRSPGRARAIAGRGPGVVRLPRAAPASPRAEAADLYRRYGPVVYRRCLRLLRNRETASDATQDVFLKLVRDLSRFQQGTPVLAWLNRVASNHCLNLRRAGRHRGDGRPEGDLEVLEAAPVTSHPDRALARQVLARFDETTRLVAVGVLVDGMEHEEVAEALGLSRRSVSRKLERFLGGARRFLAAAGDEGPAGAGQPG
jgi:RNA polymerase sigma-70 factor (ECF subfamily)